MAKTLVTTDMTFGVEAEVTDAMTISVADMSEPLV
jgi:hypothetical protein